MATGRSDYPNQVNNVLGFPFIFRGALDVRASQINEEMKMAATRTCSTCAKSSEVVSMHTAEKNFRSVGIYYSKTVRSKSVMDSCAPVAKAAMDTKVAKIQ